jgi:hypothetical protein
VSIIERLGLHLMHETADISTARRLAFRWRLWRRYLRLKAERRRLRRTLARVRGEHGAEIDAIVTKKDREIDALKLIEINLRTKLDITLRETNDRILEAYKLMGIGYSTRQLDEKISEIRQQPFEEKMQRENYPFSLRHTLADDDRARYDDAFAAHEMQGKTQGMDEATIQRVWNQNETAILDDIHNGF